MRKKVMHNATSILVWVISLGFIGFFGAGCKKAPMEKINEARVAFEACQSAGAQNYAKSEYDAAKDQLSQAEYLVVVRKEYDLATKALEESIKKSKIAEELAIANKEKIENEVTNLIPEVEKTLKDAKSVQKWAANYADKVDPKILDDLDKAIVNSEAKLSETSQALSREDYLTAQWNAAKIQELLNKNIETCQIACKTVGATSLSLKR